MSNSPKLFISIGNNVISIIVGRSDELNSFEILEKLIIPIDGIKDNKISDLNKITNLIKRNILLIEQKVNYTFKEIILILDNFETSFLNLSGFKRLNGTQISKENITYILNSLKSYVEEVEKNKKILHIFNSEYCLDKKKLNNLPIGLFGEFYTHELSLALINKNDYKNLESIFKICNLKIKKTLLESFVKGTLINELNSKIDTFFYVHMSDKKSKIFYIENNSIKYEQKFNFGTEIILNDICKITFLNNDVVKNIIFENNNMSDIPQTELLEKKFFKDNQYRKIKKKLIVDVSEARIKEISEIIYKKNVNLENLLNKKKLVFIEIEDKKISNCFQEIFIKCFTLNDLTKIQILEKPMLSEMFATADKISSYGWIKEVIPVTKRSESLISRIFRTIFG